MMKPITFHKDRVFRETKGVHFSDVWVQNQNGLDLVVHRGFSVSPPNQQGTGEKTFLQGKIERAIKVAEDHEP